MTEECMIYFFGLCVQSERLAEELFLALGVGAVIFAVLLTLSFVAAWVWPDS